jgi:hypothetical protein
MGQYHTVINTTKKELISAHGIDNGAKLMEQVGFDTSTSTALWLLLANSNGRGGGDANEHDLIGRWAGDSIVVQGDYAEEGDQGYVSDLIEYTDISNLVKFMLEEQFGKESK